MKQFIIGLNVPLLIVASLLSGCSSENGDAINNALGGTQILAKKYGQAVTVQGTVNNADGSVENATIEVTDQSGQTLITTQLQGSHSYTLEVPAGALYPVVISAYPEGSDEVLKVLMISPSLTKNDISPFSSEIIDKALALGGFSEKNIMQATMTTSRASGGQANKTEAGFTGDPTRQYGGWH